VPVDIRRFSWVRPFAGAYAYDFPTLEGFFAGNPARPEDWRDALGRTQRHPRPHQAIAGIIEAQQLKRGAPAAALAAAERLRDPRSVAVVTGQQAGLFGGPLFTLLKSLTAINLAERVATELRVPAVAIFWVDAEDHDWEEVRSCSVLTNDLELRSVTLASMAGAGERPVGALELDADVTRAIGEVAGLLPSTEFSADLQQALRSAYAPGRTMADAFARLLESMLGPRGLIVFDASDPAAKPLAADVFVREIESAGQSLALAAAAGAELSARGHEPQIDPPSDGTGLFYLDGGRVPIRRRDDRLMIGDDAHRPGDLAREAQGHPERFSPNVLLRPIVQDTLFPTICYVAGPSELAYWGQLQGVYQHFGLPMPLIHPRLTATILDSASSRFMGRYTLPLEALYQHDESALNRLLESQLPPTVELSLERAGGAVQERMSEVVEAVKALDPTLAGAARTTLGRMEHDLRTLHGKIIQAAKRRDETLRRQFIRAQTQAFPDGHQQERALASIFFVNRYGQALYERILSDLPLELGTHWLVTA
jgi:bacillithiol biosynthesis cysteine-adding enzyme BshC